MTRHVRANHQQQNPTKLKKLKFLLKNVLIDDLIKIIYDYTVDDGIICRRCNLQVSYDNNCINCEWMLSWEKIKF